MSPPELLITGATGRVGGRVARRLAAAGVPQRLLVRDPTRAPDLPGAQVHQASYDDRERAVRALDGVRTVFMVSGAEARDRVAQHVTFIDAAASAGVEHVVYTSFAAASARSTFTLGRDHWATEEHLRSSPMAWTVLRDNFYLDFLPLLVGEDGVIRGPAGDGLVSGVAIDDVADVAVAVLSAPAEHVRAMHTLTGPEGIGLADVARRVGAATGRTLRYEKETLEQAYASRAVHQAPDWQVDAWVSTYTAIAAGELAVVTDDVERVAGHPATSLEEVLARSGPS